MVSPAELHKLLSSLYEITKLNYPDKTGIDLYYDPLERVSKFYLKKIYFVRVNKKFAHFNFTFIDGYNGEIGFYYATPKYEENKNIFYNYLKKKNYLKEFHDIITNTIFDVF